MTAHSFTALDVAGWAARRARELRDTLRNQSTVEGHPVPPLRLRARAGAPGARAFWISGREAADELAAALEHVGKRLDGFGSILDFGCGPARVLPHVAALAPAAACSGCDVDQGAIAWAGQHYPVHSWSISRFDRALRYPPESIALVYSVSVFSHLDEERQDAWLAELQRVLEPDGMALLTVHGTYAFERFRQGEVRTRWCRADAFSRPSLAADEFVFEPYRRTIWNRGELRAVGDTYGLAFHGERYVREHWSRWLDVRAILPAAMTRWQDIVVCQRGPGARDVSPRGGGLVI
jgi:SAM-dependent methyltransferase